MSAAIALFLFGAVTAALSFQLPLGTLRMPGTGLFPFALGILLMALAAAQGVQLYLARPAAPQAREADGAGRRVGAFIGVVALSTVLLQAIGYVASSLLLMLGLLRALGMGWRNAVVIAAGSALCAHFLFVQWLKIPLPPGPLGF